MKQYRSILIIGIIEILIGGITLFVTLLSLIFSTNTKTPNVLFFVLITACMSTLIGIGILKFHKRSYHLLIYFSSVIVLTKILFLADIIRLNGALVTVIPPAIKDGISIMYHAAIIFYLKQPQIRRIFRA